MTFDIRDIRDTHLIFFSKKVSILFVNRNHNVVPLHRQNMTPTCGRKKSHVWQQKSINHLNIKNYGTKS